MMITAHPKDMTTTSARSLLLALAVVLAGAGCSSDDDPAADGGADTVVSPDTVTPDQGVQPDEGVDSQQPDAAADVAGDVTIEPCTYTQPIAYVDEGVDASQPCGEGDGTCVSGKLVIDTTLIQIQDGDVGEAYLFANPGGAPIMIYRVTTPPTEMPFKIPNIAAAATDACSSFQVGGRIDVGGNNQGLPGGSEDPVLPPQERLDITLNAGDQVNDLEFTIPVKMSP